MPNRKKEEINHIHRLRETKEEVQENIFVWTTISPAACWNIAGNVRVRE